MTRELNQLFDIANRFMSFVFGEKLFPVRFQVIDVGTENVEKRIAKLETARQALIESLDAMNELQREAERNKSELREVLQELEALKNKKSDVERELATVKALAEADVGTFRRIAGIPTEKHIFRERIIGFVTGVSASIVATGAVWLLAYVASKI